MNVADLLPPTNPDVLELPGDRSIQEALDRMGSEAADTVVVTLRGRPAGVFSGPELVRLLQKTPRADLDRATLDDAMTDRFTIAAPDDNIRAALSAMLNADIRHMVVVAGEKTIGRLALCEILEKMFDILDREVHRLSAYIDDLHDAGMD